MELQLLVAMDFAIFISREFVSLNLTLQNNSPPSKNYLNCRYFTWHFSYWESQGIPGPKPVPLFGTMLPMFKKVRLYFLSEDIP